jgi:hypothetical protein
MGVEFEAIQHAPPKIAKVSSGSYRSDRAADSNDPLKRQKSLEPKGVGERCLKWNMLEADLGSRLTSSHYLMRPM